MGKMVIQKMDQKKHQEFLNDLKGLMLSYDFDIGSIIGVSVIISQKDNSPAVFLRRNTTEKDLMKQIISAAYHKQPIIIMPQFTNLMQSLNTAMEKGILYKDEEGNYRFTF